MTMTRRGGNPRSMVRWSLLLSLTLLPVAACTSDSPLAPIAELEVAGFVFDAPQLQVAFAGKPNTVKATGSVEIVWPGGKGKVIPPGEEKLAFAEFEAFPATDGKAAKGSFTYRVLNPDLSPHREIVAVVVDAAVNDDDENEESRGRKAWFVAEVVSDIKICSGCGGHEPGEDGGDDGGCGGHEPGEDGGDDGGCGGHEPGEDGGDDGGCEGGSSGGHSGGLPGKDPRVGQFVVVKVHDKATPGAGENGDGITWKWFAPDDEKLIGILSQIDVEPKKGLCKKTIIGGNLVVHPVPEG